ncbi:MAG: hypothetical protein A3H01_02055 [Candidatus Wildermuthbacteria bacterium RIFCSPLOWO2_12_FULL_40_9]|nr:MAG: hypothetical protein A3H01_02055 [Candidatus Wildermuthbacteria bacterium RIFCSPLOWO2_12_FULL_40_9]
MQFLISSYFVLIKMNKLYKKFSFTAGDLVQNQKLNFSWEIPFNFVAERSEATNESLTFPYWFPYWTHSEMLTGRK